MPFFNINFSYFVSVIYGENKKISKKNYPINHIVWHINK